MAMTIVESRLVKHRVSRSASGLACDVEIDVDFTGVYDPLAAEAVASVTPNGFGAPMAIGYGAELGTGSGLYITSKTADFKECATSTLVGEYRLTIRYEESPFALAENPLLRKDQIFWNRNGVQTPIYADADNKPILTAAREVFATMPTVNVPCFGCTIFGYRADYSKLRFAADKFNVVNSDPLNLKGVSVGAKSARYLSAQTREERINGVNVVAYTWQLDFKESWDLKLVNRGNYELSGGKQVRIKDDNGVIRQSPWPLTAAGVSLPDNYAAADVNNLTFKTTIEVSFATAFGWSF